MAEASDQLQALVAAAREGDNVAVRELVRRTQPAIWRLCNVLGSPGEEDDLVQDTYLRAFRSLATYRGEAPFTAWLLSTARRVCADHVVAGCASVELSVRWLILPTTSGSRRQESDVGSSRGD